MTVFDTDIYLRRLGHDSERAGRPAPDLATLVRLHKRHMEAVPFSSTGSLAVPTASGAVVDLVDFDQDATFDAVVAAGRGGGCVQMTRLFQRLLRELGYEADLIAGTTAEGEAEYGVDVEHMLLVVRVDGVRRLVDVGYAGPSFLEPLRLDGATDGREQVQYGCRYRLVEEGDGVLLQRRPRLGRWSTVYRFTPKVREPDEWHAFQDLANVKLAAVTLESAPQLYSRAVADGQVVLKGRRLLTVRAGIEKSRTLTDDGEVRAVRDAILDGTLG
ncbi:MULTISPECIES: arylamine N-acetyltransferase family protein [Streptomyces]|uniref:Arylamine N-acetyltransferase n=1 Tax=Streptomyces tricolor TaxID=68277 RepID=A0ABS9J8S4_9ACTN|nr:arylamine N-acetyltransferase [Streptomyces tricolor]MCG0061955.1 arylamine N-acetyltransferase [Streptomyces tricolor]